MYVIYVRSRVWRAAPSCRPARPARGRRAGASGCGAATRGASWRGTSRSVWSTSTTVGNAIVHGGGVMSRTRVGVRQMQRRRAMAAGFPPGSRYQGRIPRPDGATARQATIRGRLRNTGRSKPVALRLPVHRRLGIEACAQRAAARLCQELSLWPASEATDNLKPEDCEMHEDWVPESHRWHVSTACSEVRAACACLLHWAGEAV